MLVLTMPIMFAGGRCLWRRLRAKLGEEHAHLIETVRSVGYRFGQVSWAQGTALGSLPSGDEPSVVGFDR